MSGGWKNEACVCVCVCVCVFAYWFVCAATVMVAPDLSVKVLAGVLPVCPPQASNVGYVYDPLDTYVSYLGATKSIHNSTRTTQHAAHAHTDTLILHTYTHAQQLCQDTHRQTIHAYIHVHARMHTGTY